MKRIESPVKKWPGYVLLHDPLPLVKQADFDDAVRRAIEVSQDLSTSRARAILVPALLPCIAEWHLDGFPENVTADTFPGVGTGLKQASARLIAFLVEQVIAMYQGGDDPNE